MPEETDCPVCFTRLSATSSPFIALSCGHIICSSCASEADSHGHESCPLCRKPHLLDPTKLAERQAKYRSKYGQWRVRSSVSIANL